MEFNLDFDFLKFPAAIVACIAIFLMIRHYLTPIRIAPSYKMVFDASSPDSISAKVTNMTDGPIVLTRIEAKPTYSLKTIITRHLKNPIASKKIWSNIHYGFPIYELLGEEPFRLESKDQKEFRANIRNHPLGLISAPMLLIEVELSTERKFRSRRIEAPKRWLLVNNIKQLRKREMKQPNI